MLHHARALPLLLIALTLPTASHAKPVAIAVSASISNPAPRQYSTETVTGRFLVGGKGVAGVPMSTEWHYKTVTSACSGITNVSGLATCSRRISRATHGYAVKIDVHFTYKGKGYGAATAFTTQ